MKVLKPFRDKYNPEHIFLPGDEFESNDQGRITDLVKRGLIEGEQSPSFDQLKTSNRRPKKKGSG